VPTARKQVYSVLDHISGSLEGLDATTMRAVLPVLNQAHSEVETQLRRWIARQHGSDRFTTQRYRNVLLHLSSAIEKLEASGVAMEHGLKKSYATIAPLSLHNVQREWKAFSKIFEGTAQPIALDEAVLISSGKKLMWPRFESSAKKYAGDIGTRAKLELAVSRARSETIDELTRRLQRRLPDVFRRNRSDAERFARTETMSAYNAVHESAIAEAHAEDPEIRSRWEASRDFRRCRMCASLDGQIIDRSKGEKFVAEWMSRSKRGTKWHVMTIESDVAHPYCRCSVVPWRASWSAYARNKQEIDEGGRLAA
jgi:hypothetical protein